MFKKFISLIFIFTLVACAKHPAVVEKASDATKQALEALEASLPETCATDAIKSQINAIRAQIASIESACESDKETAVAEERDKKRKWQIAFLSLLALVLGFLGVRKYLKA